MIAKLITSFMTAGTASFQIMYALASHASKAGIYIKQVVEEIRSSRFTVESPHSKSTYPFHG